MERLLAVGLGGCLGAIARFSLTGLMQRRFPAYLESGTLLVNVLGCVFIGFLMVFVHKQMLSETARALLMTGFLGSLTTFSTFGYETVELWSESNLRLAFWNVAGNLCLGFAGVMLGRLLARAVWG